VPSALVWDVIRAGLLRAIELVRPDGSGERFAPADRHALPTVDAVIHA
jgi:hypothetical protein